MRKIGLFTDGVFRQNDFERGFELMKKSGFDCADYSGLINLNSDLGLLTGAELIAQMRKVKTAADNAGIEIYQMHGPWCAPLPNLTAEERRAWTDYAKKCILVSEVLGSPRYVVHPIMPFGVRGKEDPEVVYACNREFLTEICECAKTVGVNVCFENMPFPWMTVHSPQHIYDIIKDLGIDNLKMCLDTGHSLISDVEPADAVDNFGEVIEALHVHDNHKQTDTHLTPFSGKIDWEKFADSVAKSIPESVPMMLETPLSFNLPDETREHFLKGYAGIAKLLAGRKN